MEMELKRPKDEITMREERWEMNAGQSESLHEEITLQQQDKINQRSWILLVGEILGIIPLKHKRGFGAGWQVQLHSCLMLHVLKRIRQLQRPGQSVPELPERAHSAQKKPSGVQFLFCRVINTLLNLSQETLLGILRVLKELWEEVVTRLYLGVVGCAASGDGITGAVDQALPLACMVGHEPDGRRNALPIPSNEGIYYG